MRISTVCALLLVGGTMAGAALAQGVPLKVDEVTEAGIVDALAAPVASTAESAPRMRGFTLAPLPQNSHEALHPPSAAVLITFVTDSSELTPDSKQALNVIAMAMKNQKLAESSFIVEGHADPRGDASHNMDLSRRRADSVVDFLAHERGIDRQRLLAAGKGSTEPLNIKQADAPENRRVVFITRTN